MISYVANARLAVDLAVATKKTLLRMEAGWEVLVLLVALQRPEVLENCRPLKTRSTFLRN